MRQAPREKLCMLNREEKTVTKDGESRRMFSGFVAESMSPKTEPRECNRKRGIPSVQWISSVVVPFVSIFSLS